MNRSCVESMNTLPAGSTTVIRAMYASSIAACSATASSATPSPRAWYGGSVGSTKPASRGCTSLCAASRCGVFGSISVSARVAGCQLLAATHCWSFAIPVVIVAPCARAMNAAKAMGFIV